MIEIYEHLDGEWAFWDERSCANTVRGVPVQFK